MAPLHSDRKATGSPGRLLLRRQFRLGLGFRRRCRYLHLDLHVSLRVMYPDKTSRMAPLTRRFHGSLTVPRKCHCSHTRTSLGGTCEPILPPLFSQKMLIRPSWRPHLVVSFLYLKVGSPLSSFRSTHRAYSYNKQSCAMAPSKTDLSHLGNPHARRHPTMCGLIGPQPTSYRLCWGSADFRPPHVGVRGVGDPNVSLFGVC
jgi:hypothetical protein